ncbi:Rossmann-like and DUF2520 domain-containing protein [Caldicellulosiruptor naganoensis]|uniref:DUF2520 domain-containing protein n=1 Tax=Caldicellulosiruptor naganoensis TaxID=29324 RepID=A0ABY7BJ41_9FIRM|nr:Rossmann-like and DUF2520 domain-containing protein [Caldicellulosiruptor naganoensis]WAM31051.1 DUF2520 domain-containing protein [Caldicellulosiruptor naganoensis]
MKIGFYGASRAGISLGLYFINKGLEVVGYYNRTYEKAKEASNLTNTKVFKTPEELIKSSDVIFLSVSDSAIEEVSKNLPQEISKSKVFAHLSGALLSSAIKVSCKGRFSLHPVQTLRGKIEDVQKLNDAVFSLEGDELGKEIGKIILQKLGNKYIELKKEDKVKYHLAATIASNYLIGLLNFSYSIYKDLKLSDDIIFSMIGPLAKASLENFLKDRLNSLTGPASRGDIPILEKHYTVLSDSQRNTFLELLKLTSELIKERGQLEVFEKLQDFIKSKGGE